MGPARGGFGWIEVVVGFGARFLCLGAPVWSGGVLGLELLGRDRNWQVEGQFNDSTDSGLEKR